MLPGALATRVYVGWMGDAALFCQALSAESFLARCECLAKTRCSWTPCESKRESEVLCSLEPSSNAAPSSQASRPPCPFGLFKEGDAALFCQALSAESFLARCECLAKTRCSWTPCESKRESEVLSKFCLVCLPHKKSSMHAPQCRTLNPTIQLQRLGQTS